MIINKKARGLLISTYSDVIGCILKQGLAIKQDGMYTLHMQGKSEREFRTSKGLLV